jgi:hypothetical protein
MLPPAWRWFMSQSQSEDRWRAILREFRDSGTTRKAFCESHGIALSTLGYWLKRTSAPEKSPRAAAAFVPIGGVELRLPTVLRIRLGGEVVAELDLPADEAVIRDLLRVLISL